MAIDQTALLDYQLTAAVEQERFASQFGLIRAINQETPKMPYLTPELKALLNKIEGRAVRIPAIKKGAITVATSESFDIPLNVGTTAYSTLSLVTLFAGFGIFPEDYENNMVSVSAMKANRIRECDEAMALAYEALIAAFLNTNKTLVWSGTDTSLGFDFSSSILTISKDAQKDAVFAHLRTMAAANNWNADQALLIANPLIGSVLNEILKYGANNDKNLAFQILPQIFTSNRVTNSTGMRFTAYMVEDGSIGAVPNYKLPFREQKVVGGAKWDISSMAMPMLGDKVGLYEEVEKASSANGAMSWVEKTGFVYSFFFLKKYNSDTATQVGNILKIDGDKL
jgi:hypothetical protein